MVPAAPSGSFAANAYGFATGLTGTVGVQVLNKDGTVAIARKTTGIVEAPAGSGIYIATWTTAPATPGYYVILWDNGTISPSTDAADDLVVSSAFKF